MRLYEKPERFLLLVVLSLIACNEQQDPQQSGYQLRIASAHLEQSQSRQSLQLDLRHQFSPTLVEALHNGVELTYAWRLELMDADGSPWQGRRWLDDGSVTVSYRSFTQWYTLRQQPSELSKDYPDLERTHQALETLSVPVEIPRNLMVANSPYRFRFRIHLDINRLPPPLRLPAHMTPAWRLDSGWHEWWPPAAGQQR